MDKALRSEPVFIRRGTRLVQIVPAVLPEPIAIRPEGYFTVDEDRAAFINSMPIDDSPLAR